MNNESHIIIHGISPSIWWGINGCLLAPMACPHPEVAHFIQAKTQSLHHAQKSIVQGMLLIAFCPRLFLSYYFYHPTPKLLVDIEITNYHVPTHIPLNCCCSRMQHQALNHQLNGFYLIHHQLNINENGLGLGQVHTECRLKLLYGDQDLHRSIEKDL